MADYATRTVGSKKTKKRPRLSTESKTPPLPTKSLCGIEDLIKRRDYLKMKIKSFESNPKGNNKIRELSTEEKNKNKKEHLYQNNKPPLICSYDTTSESEDEETIIMQRRQQRQKLLEQFKVSTSQNNRDVVVCKEQNDIDKNINKDVTIVAAKQTKQDEIADMFSELNEFTYTNTKKSPIEEDRLSDNIHDSKGYYCVRIGDTLKDGRYIISGLLGQGVFANVVRAHDKIVKTNVAIKIVRKNELITKNSLREVSFLKQINTADPADKHYCVRFLGEFVQKGHLCIVLELFHMNLRSFIKKYSKNGFSLDDVKKYSIQLLMALNLLNKLNIIHADIKPDNILVDQSRSTLKLCDFGSATNTLETKSPYLVSRYYRAPEIILGAPYDNSIDIWSLACTIYEMATGNILFTGANNNKMLKGFIDLKGKFPPKVVRKGVFKHHHFNQFNEFVLKDVDACTRKEKVKVIRNDKPTRDLLGNLKKYCKIDILENSKKLCQLKDLLDKMTMLDPMQRIRVTDALIHPFLVRTHTR